MPLSTTRKEDTLTIQDAFKWLDWSMELTDWDVMQLTVRWDFDAKEASIVMAVGVEQGGLTWVSTAAEMRLMRAEDEPERYRPNLEERVIGWPDHHIRRLMDARWRESHRS